MLLVWSYIVKRGQRLLRSGVRRNFVRGAREAVAHPAPAARG